MELFNENNPYYEKWKPGRPSKEARTRRKLYWAFEEIHNGLASIPVFGKKSKLSKTEQPDNQTSIL